MKVSRAGLNLIKHFEGYHTELDDGRCAAYLDPAGVPTIGWGSTHGVTLGMVWSRDQAEEALMSELSDCSAKITQLVTVPLNQSQHDALASFVYNLGPGAFGRSTLLRKLNRGDYAGAEDEFGRWVYASKGAGGPRVKYNGLIRRRKAEAAMFAENEIIPVPVPEPITVAVPKEPTTKPIKVPWYSMPLAAVTSAGAWFADQLENLGQLLTSAGGQYLGLSSAASMVQATGISIAPVMAFFAVLSVFIAAKTMMSEPETVE